MGRFSWALALFCYEMVIGAQIQPVGKPGKVQLSVIRKVPMDYYMLTSGKPLVFGVDAVGDTGVWLRVYTRVWWRQSVDKASYSILFITGDSSRSFRFETERSNRTLGPEGQPLGKWRSFYVKLTPGDTVFKLLMDSAQDTVAIRLSFEVPAKWKRVVIPGRKELTVVVERDSERVSWNGYYRIHRDGPFDVDVFSPGPIRLRVRLDFDPTMRGEQGFVLEVKEDGKTIIEKSFWVKKALFTHYEEIGDVIPSVERVLRLNLEPGNHRLRIILLGTSAKSGALMVERIVDEKGDE